MTLTKLDSLVHHHTTPAKNAMQEKIGTLPKAKILAVDDMEMNLKLLHTWLDHSPVELPQRSVDKTPSINAKPKSLT